MIKDAKGRKWFMRFRQYRNGWHWEARHGHIGQQAGRVFKTKVLAEDDARRSIQGRDAIAVSQEYFRRLRKRGTECQLTADDQKAIARAGEVR
jgi:hypothetical protein